ncbi:hypothetical protein K469DRAFT_572250 [Zopfia rhizophila CBS 207.26]|uniref:Uncharacterized protein n=1 Tax=Zopfia rhizophila CBS 207.26 TaxID=1314779 RepID=A0A6A6EA17_9PEZI|nr:hypothetical protein K469DRAFT_572250 [Zopfia rhizophila CBS 207.26]
MLQNIQTELSAHRSIMLDIQHRVSHLEHESVASANGDAPQLAALQALEGHGSKRNSRLVPPEGQTWWQACQNFARNSDPPMSAAEFLRTPKRFSGIDWQYGPPSAKPQTPPMTPPDVEELPPLTPTSEDEDSEHSDIDTPRAKHDVEINADEVIASTPKEAEVEIQDDIKESFVDVDKKKMPSAPILHPPPGGKPISVNSEEVITAVPTAPVASIDNPHRYYKGKRSLATYQAVLKHKKTDKEQIVLIHFHNRSALKDLEE